MAINIFHTITLITSYKGIVEQVLFSDSPVCLSKGNSLFSVMAPTSRTGLKNLLAQATSLYLSESQELVMLTPSGEMVFRVTASRSGNFLILHCVGVPVVAGSGKEGENFALTGTKTAVAGNTIPNITTPQHTKANSIQTQIISAKAGKNEEQLRLLLEATREGVLQVDTELKIVYANRQMCTLTGFDFNEMEGHNPAELFKIEETGLQQIEYQHSLRNQGLASVYEIEICRKDGERIWVSLSAVPVLNEDGEIIGSIASHLDITEQHLAKKQLELSEKRYRTLFHQNPLPMWVYSSETKQILDVNSAAIKHYGYTEQEFLSMTPLGLRQEEDKAGFGKCITELKKGNAFSIEGRHIKKYGEIIDVQVTASRLNYEGTDGILVIAKDVSSQKKAETKIRKTTLALQESEARYKSLFEQSPNPVFSIDASGIVTGANAAFREIFNTSVCKTKPASFLEIIDPDLHQTASAFLLKILRGETGSYDSVVIDQENNRRIVNITQLPILVNGVIVGAYGMIQDNTELFYTTQELRQSHRELRELTSRIQVAQEEERKYIALEIHDELGQILTALNIDVTLLTNKVISLLDEQKAAELHADLEELKTISTEAIRSVKRIVSELRPIALDEIGLPAEIVLYLKRFESRYAIETSLSMPDVQLHLSKSQAIEVYRIFQEALTNVARHSEASNVWVTIAQDAERIQLTIEDNGKGIESAETTAGRSFGLIGMRERALMMGGNLNITSAEQKGTIISLQLPINQILLEQEQQKKNLIHERVMC